MGISLNSLMVGKAEADVEYAGQTIKIEFNPRSITPKMMALLNTEGTTANTQLLNFVDALVVILLNWNVEENGVPVPITKEVLTNLPLDLLNEMFTVATKAIGEKKGS